MIYDNLPCGVTDRDIDKAMGADAPNFPHTPNCPFCGNRTIFIEGWKKGEYYLHCEHCGMSTDDYAEFQSAIDAVNESKYKDVPNCPICDSKEELTIFRKQIGDINYYRVECRCGISGQWGKDFAEALEKWQNNF